MHMLHLETIQTTLYLTALSLCLMAVVKKIAYGHNNNEGYRLQSNEFKPFICNNMQKIVHDSLNIQDDIFSISCRKLYSNNMCY